MRRNGAWTTSLCALLLLPAAACFRGTDPNVAESGLGVPQLTIEFPERARAGSQHTAELTIVNPGPGDLDSLLVTFNAVGGSSAQGIPTPIVRQGPQRDSAVVDVRPAPDAVSADGVVYRFGGLDEGETTTIEFDLEVPEEPGRAANAVIVSDGHELDRAQGVRLETQVQ